MNLLLEMGARKRAESRLRTDRCEFGTGEVAVPISKPSTH